MDFCKEPKLLLEFESRASGQHEENPQNETDRVEAKHQRKELIESSGDNFEEFVALMERIQYTKTQHMNFGIWEEIFMGEDLDVKVIKSKAPRMPSFQWEDFCASKDTVSAQKDVCRVSAKDNPSSYEGKDKQSVQPAESFDLNVEALSNV